MKRTIHACLLLCIATASRAQEFSDPSRTENKNDAGLAGTKSGFFQASAPVNYPAGAGSYWHLLDVRHSNPANNYAMQFAGSFYDQDLYFRKTNNNPSQPWRRVLTVGTDNLLGGLSAVVSPMYTVVNNGQGDLVNGSPWYGLGMSSLNLGQSGNLVQLAGHWGISFQTFRTQMVLTYGGNVGIGTLTPTAKLAVNGTVKAREVNVTVNGSDWPDYVFSGGYRLPSLDSLSSRIAELGHLPGMPSAQEVGENGVDLGEMNRKLLEKVEELTLLLIGQGKEIAELKKAVSAAKGPNRQ